MSENPKGTRYLLKSENQKVPGTFCSLLMCPPDYYDIVYEINPWMSVKRQADHKKAVRQWTDFYELLTQTLKVKVELLEPQRGLPDMVFTANAGLVHKNHFIKSNFRHKERKGEEPFYEAWFRKHKYRIKTIPKPFCFEGEGDALFMGKSLYTGYHFRSDIEAHDMLSGYLKVTYDGLQLKDSFFYHLDTCFAPLNEESALMYLPAFDTYSQLILLENIPDPIKVPEDEALRFACNAVVVGKNVVTSEGCPKTAKQLEKRGFHVYSLDFSEFMKAGGAAKCLVLKL
ncbi:MAG: amidinotransferase [Candidatus Omnitrophica bacterium]|nr:amidinotransferase [Candidatus Omnitrophota bacterium]